MNTPAEETLRDVLPYAPADDRIDDVKELLMQQWGGRSAAEIAAMNMFTVVRQLAEIMPDGEYGNGDRAAAAEGLHALLDRFGFTSQQPAGAGPVNVKVDLPRSPEQMPLRDLLGLLAEEPGQYEEIRPYLSRHPQVQAAQQNTNGAWAIPGSDGRGLDPEATAEYITQVSRRHAAPQRRFRGRRPVTLAAALGQSDRALIHPFTGRPVTGPDENGFDFGQLTAEVHEALLWAAVNGHAAWPQNADPYTCCEEVFRTPLPHRWALILEDYQAARAAEDPSTRVITRYWPEGLSLEQVVDLSAELIPGGAPARGRQRASHEQAVTEKAAMVDVLEGAGCDNRYAGGVYRKVRFAGNDNHFDGIVFTEGGTIAGNDNRGNLLLPPGVRVRVVGSDNRINQQNISWADLAGHLGIA